MERLGFADGKEVLCHYRGIYSWGKNISIVLDTDRIDALSEEISTANLEQAMEVIPVYKGDFLPNASGSPWAIPMRTHYHNKYLKICNETARVLYGLQRYDDVEHVCQSAIAIDSFEESIHILLMRAYTAAGAKQVAIQHYLDVKSLFMDQLGMSPSREMLGLYLELVKSNMNLEMNLGAIQKELSESEPNTGAFYCEYPSFRDIYRIAVRNAASRNQLFHLVVITVLDNDSDKLAANRCSVAMDKLKLIIQGKLRAGDSFMRFSAAQFLILLPTADHDDTIKIINRILYHYQCTMIGMTTVAKFSLLPIQPGDESVEHALEFISKM